MPLEGGDNPREEELPVDWNQRLGAEKEEKKKDLRTIMGKQTIGIVHTTGKRRNYEIRRKLRYA